MNNREIGIDVVKAVSILMVIFLHMLGHSNLLNGGTDTILNVFYWSLEAFCLPAVNLFVITTGYLLIQKDVKIHKIFPTYLSVIFYSLICFILFSPNKNLFTIIQAFTPILSRTYWFITNYFLLYIFSPYINMLLNRLSNDQFKNLLFKLLIIFSLQPLIFFYSDFNSIFGGGTGILWFLILYSVGAYIRKYEFDVDIKKLFPIIILNILLFIFVLMLNSNYENNFFKNCQLYLMNYNSPNIFLCAISLFIILKKISFENKKIVKIFYSLSSASLSVYLIHDNPYIRDVLWKSLHLYDLKYNYVVQLSLIIIIPIIIFTFCIIIDFIRRSLFKLLLSKYMFNVKRE